MAFSYDSGDSYVTYSAGAVILILIIYILINVWSTWYYIKLRDRNITNQTHSLSLLAVIASWMGAFPFAVVSPAVYYYSDPGKSPFTA